MPAMSKKLAELEALFADLTGERTELDTTVEQMIADMAGVPVDQRSKSGWASDGPLTRKFLDLTNRQAALEAEIHDVTRAIAELKGAPLPH